MWARPERKDRIIFLDVDGVMDSIHFFKSKAYHSRKFKYGCDMSNMINRYNLFWVGLLCKVTGARVVLSSTWKYGYNEDGTVKEMEKGHNLHMTDELFRKYGVNVFSVTRKGELVPPDWELNKEALKDWCEHMEHTSFIECSKEDFTMKYCRGTQIAEWIVRNNYQGNYIVVDDDVSDIVFYKDLEKRLVKTSYYKRYDGFRFLHFLKGLRLLLWGCKMTKEEKEQKLYEEWKQRGLERFVPESKLTLEDFRKQKMKFAMQNYSNVDMNEWNY